MIKIIHSDSKAHFLGTCKNYSVNVWLTLHAAVYYLWKKHFDLINHNKKKSHCIFIFSHTTEHSEKQESQYSISSAHTYFIDFLCYNHKAYCFCLMEKKTH